MNSQLNKIKALIDALSEEVPDLYVHGMTLECGSIEVGTSFLEPQTIPKYHIGTSVGIKDAYVAIVGNGRFSGHISIKDLIEFLKQETT